MEKTIQIPEQLWEQLTLYLKDHPHENLSTLIHAALSEKIRPRNGARVKPKICGDELAELRSAKN